MIFARRILITLSGLFLSTQIFAQIDYQATSYNKHDFVNSLYIEFGGSGTYLTFNYDLSINQSTVIRFGAIPTLFSNPDDENSPTNNNETPAIGVISLSRLVAISKSQNNIETGVGFAIGNIQTNEHPGAPSLFLNFGYRFLSRKEKGGVIRASFTPFISDGKIHPWFGVSFGYSFKNWTHD